MKAELKSVGNGCLAGSLALAVAIPTTRPALELLHAPAAALGAIVAASSTATTDVVAVNTTLDYVHVVVPPVPFKIIAPST